MSHRRKHLATLGALAAVLAVAASLVVAGARTPAAAQTYAPPPPPPTGPEPVSVTIDPTVGGILSVDAGHANLNISIPAGTIAVQVDFTPVGQADIGPHDVTEPALPTGVGHPRDHLPSGAALDPQTISIVNLFELNAWNAAGQTVDPGVVVTIRTELSAEVRALVGGDLSRVFLMRYDPQAGGWQPVPCEPSPDGQSIVCETERFSLWALVTGRALPGTFSDPAAIPAHGLGLVLWDGGTVDQLAIASTAAGVASVWTTHDGRLVGLVIGAPQFVNQPFVDAFPDEVVPAGLGLLVLVR